MAQHGGHIDWRATMKPERVAAWPWTDNNPTITRYGIFFRSAEALTTAFLVAYAAVFMAPGNTLTSGAAFRWLAAVSDARELPWAALAFALAVTGPLALWWDKGALRALSLASQGGFFLALGISFFANSPLGLGWITFVIAGVWLVGRALLLVRHFARGG